MYVCSCKGGRVMSVNGITGASDLYSAYSAQPAVTESKSAETKSEEVSASAENGVVYEKSDSSSASKATYANPTLVAQLKADAENRTAQLQSLVEKLIIQQKGAFDKATNIWDMLRKGEVEVDPETRAQAQKDIAEDGYWGVTQTSDRIIDFAKALAGDDPEKLAEMKEAFLKGYKQAEKTWGGELPEISKRTYDAVLDKFDKLINGDVTAVQA